MDTKFSIIIPVYNVEDYLNKCLDSILFQDYINFEVICINDGSTDNSLAILKEYEKENENLSIINRINQGPSSARNEGLRLAKGDYILFLDSDDYFYHNYVLSELFSVIKDNNIDCVYFPGGCETPDWSGTEKYSVKHYSNGWDCLIENCRRSKILVFGSIYSQCYKRAVLLENNLFFNEDLVYAEDRLFVVQFFFFAKKTIVYPEPLYCYNLRNGSLMTSENSDLKISNVKKSAELIYMFCKSNNISNKKSILIYANAMYVSAVLDEYKLKRINNINKTILFATGIGFSKLFQSLLLYLHPFLYLFYKGTASKILLIYKKARKYE